MPNHSHVDFRAVPSKRDFIHARGHKMNPRLLSSPMFFGIETLLGSNPSPSSRIRTDRASSGSQLY
jgi:hypothetical protein